VQRLGPDRMTVHHRLRKCMHSYEPRKESIGQIVEHSARKQSRHIVHMFNKTTSTRERKRNEKENAVLRKTRSGNSAMNVPRQVSPDCETSQKRSEMSVTKSQRPRMEWLFLAVQALIRHYTEHPTAWIQMRVNSCVTNDSRKYLLGCIECCQTKPHEL